jgi:hypothetical protein
LSLGFSLHIGIVRDAHRGTVSNTVMRIQ